MHNPFRRIASAIAAASLMSAVVVISVAARAADVPSFARAVPKVRSGEPIFAFNGKDLTGFYTYLKESQYDDPKKVVTVKDGAIRVSGEDFGGFTTREEFHDYRLVVEWKWGGAAYPPRKANARDSGILLHCNGRDGSYAGYWMESQECQIIEGGTGDFIMVGAKEKTTPSLTAELRLGPDKQYYFEPGATPITRTGGRNNWWGRDPKWKDVIGFRGERDVDKPSGEWNRLEIICDGDSITNVVNGYVVNSATKSSLTRGKILFQSEGAEILFRKIEVRPIIK